MAMIFRLTTGVALLAGACAAACLPATASRITGHDLALAQPAFAALPANYTVGIAPEPGTKRTFTAAELERIAAANHIPKTAFTEVCFEVPTRNLAEEDVLAAMKRVLPPGTEVKIIEVSKGAEPAGTIEFALASLEPPSADVGGSQLWRGFVRYAETRKAPIWARVSVVEHFKAVVATRDLAPNTVLGSFGISVEERTGPPRRDKFAVNLNEVAGRQLLRSIKAGDVIPLAALSPAWDIRRGDPIRVEVQSGEARLSLDAIAESQAREGDMVQIRNPGSGKMFRARLEQGSRAILIISPGAGL
jgi:flagella basal body P-ring formation protein FlgA